MELALGKRGKVALTDLSPDLKRIAYVALEQLYLHAMFTDAFPDVASLEKFILVWKFLVDAADKAGKPEVKNQILKDPDYATTFTEMVSLW